MHALDWGGINSSTHNKKTYVTLPEHMNRSCDWISALTSGSMSLYTVSNVALEIPGQKSVIKIIWLPHKPVPHIRIPKQQVSSSKCRITCQRLLLRFVCNLLYKKTEATLASPVAATFSFYYWCLLQFPSKWFCSFEHLLDAQMFHAIFKFSKKLNDQVWMET